MGIFIIGIDGQFLLRIDLDGNEDFITEADLINFVIQEEAGGTLPTFNLAFRSENESLVYKFQEGVSLSISLGATNNNMVDYELQIVNVSLQKSQINYTVELVGMLDSLDYLSQGNTKIFPETDAISTLKEISSKYFTWAKGNITKSMDRQKWIQYGLTDKKMVHNLWLRCDIGDNDVPLLGISGNKEIIVKSLRQSLTSFSWNFTTREDDHNNTIQITPDYGVENLGAFINGWLGYGRKKPIYMFEEGEETENLFKATPFIAIASEIKRAQGIEYKTTEVGIIGENTHKKYWESYYSNLTNLATMSTLNINISFINEFKELGLLDYVSFFDKTVKSDEGVLSPYSGGYFITRITRQVRDRTLYTQVQLTRDGLNKGS